MTDKKKLNKTVGMKAYITNAAVENYQTEPETNIPIASDNAVEEAREWVNEGSNL